MILTSSNTPVITSGGSTASSFSVKVNHKTFKVLSSNLYKNKAGSIVREICSNAYDAHVSAGIPEIAFEVHLPDAYEPWFSVKDFGAGLTPDQIKTVFCVYFESTKDKTNDNLGGFGLGAKTPFSYTDQFTVTSHAQGECNIYSAYINSEGIPDIKLMATSPSSETGVTIQLSVKREDYTTFETEVENQLQYFKVKPVFSNGDCTWDTPAKPIFSSNNAILVENSYGGAVTIIQGVVGYPLDKATLQPKLTPEESKTLDLLHSFRTQLLFNIGEIGVIASREGIEYDDATVGNIKAKLQVVQKEIDSYVQSQLQQCTSDWDKVVFINANRGLQVMAKNTIQCAVNHYGELRYSFDCLQPNQPVTPYNRTIVPYLNAITKRSVAFAVTPTGTLAMKKIAFVIVDKPRLANLKVTHLKETQGFTSVYLIVVKGEMPADIEDKIKKNFGGFDQIFKTSEIELPKAVRDTARIKSATCTHYAINGLSSASWTKQFSKLEDIEQPKLYVVVDRLSMGFNDQQSLSKLNTIRKLLPFTPEVIGVTEANAKKIKGNLNLVPLKGYVDSAVAELITPQVKIRIKRNQLVRTLKGVPSSMLMTKAKEIIQVNPKNKLFKMLDMLVKYQEKSTDTWLESLSGFNSYDLVSKRKDNFNAFYKKELEKYPLLKAAQHSTSGTIPTSHIAAYVQAVDSLSI